MVTSLLSIILLLLFAEMASANFKRLAPVLEAWEQSKKDIPTNTAEGFFWKGGWEKLATLVWALGTAVPLLAFAIGCKLFIHEPVQMGNIILGAAIGNSVIGLSLIFGIVLLSGQITFFRVRTVNSPVFLLLATITFTYVCLNKQIGVTEGFFLLIALVSYGFYFRRFSSEWKYFERNFAKESLVESSEGILPILAIACMGVGFFLLAIIASFPFIQELQIWILGKDPLKMGVHFVALILSVPWILRCVFFVQSSDTAKAITITSISHACLINLLLIPAILSFFFADTFSSSLLSVHLPLLLILTATFVSTLLIEKEFGGFLTWILILTYVVYTGFGLFY